MARFFRFPWALTGDRSDIPDEKQADGSVSFQEGYGPSYELDPASSPNARNIERRIYNQLLHDITSTLKQYYQFGVPPFIAPEMNGGSSFAYGRYARVLYEGRVYESLIDNNTSLPTVTASWKVIDAGADSDIPPGLISGFAGTEAQIPAKWQLCNGSGTTSNGISIPDLRNRMIIGAGSSYSTGNTGGSTSATTSSAGSHSHSISINNTTLSISSIPSHTHRTYNTLAGSFGNSEVRENSYGAGNIVQTANWGNHRSPENTGSSGSHNHSGSSSSSGSHNHTVSTMPPYYALAFIIKL